MQRLCLEHGYAALHATGRTKAHVGGTGAGVYLGYSSQDFSAVIQGTPVASSVYSATGGSQSIASGRLSFVLGLQGPCMLIDTSCSSGLTATSVACSALSLDECPLAVVLAVNVMMAGSVHFSFAIAGMLSELWGSCRLGSR